jgi:hypothetical protein
VICMYGTENDMCTCAALSNMHMHMHMTERYRGFAESPTARSRKKETGTNTPKEREGGTTDSIPTPRDVSSRLAYVKWVWDGMSVSVSRLWPGGGQHANFGRDEARAANNT